jgi:hypothetical protein
MTEMMKSADKAIKNCNFVRVFEEKQRYTENPKYKR